MSFDLSPAGKTRAVVHDSWDKKDLKRALKENRALGRARRKINDFAWTGSDAVDDAFFVLHKADPHLLPRSEMRVSHFINHQVIAELLVTPAARRLREYTVGDLDQAALATIEISHKLEAIFDRLTLAQEAAERLQATLDALATARQMRDRIEDEVLVLLDDSESNAAVDTREAAGRLANAQAAVALLEGVAEGMSADLMAAMAEAAPDMASTVADAVSGACDTTAGFEQVARTWGVMPGQLGRLPASERLALAKQLNTSRSARIADLFGRIENLALSTAAEEVDDLHDDVVDLEFGADLSRVLSSEFLALAEPSTEMGFIARLANEELLQVAVRGTEEQGRGGIVMCIDGSGSMGIGQRDLWAKATMLVLLHRARTQGRRMHVIHFGYRKMLHREFLRPEDFTAERILQSAEAFWASGTDFEAPMAKAVEVLRAEFDDTGHTKADVVFATDDECWVPPVPMESYLGAMRTMGARTWGLMVEGEARPNGALWQMSEGRVLTVRDLTTGGDLRPLLAGVR